MTDTIFSELARIKNRGGALNMEHVHLRTKQMKNVIEGQFQEFVKELNDTFTECKGVRPFIGLTNHPKFNAWVHPFDGIDYIGLPAPVMFWLRSMFSILEKNGFDKDYFLHTKAVYQAEIKLPNQEQFMSNLSSEINDGQFDYALADEDAVIPQVMFYIALQFILQHELAHIWNGHANYKSDLKMVDGLDESDTNNVLADIEYYALEMDADSRSIRGTLLWYIRKYQVPITDVKEYSPELTDDEMVILVSSISTCTLVMTSIYLANRMAMYINGCQKYSLFNGHIRHPPLVYRLILLLNCAHQTVEEMMGRNSLIITAALHEGFRKAEAAFCLISGESAIDVVEELNNGRYTELHREVLEKWNEIRPLLIPHMRGRDLPYAIVE